MVVSLAGFSRTMWTSRGLRSLCSVGPGKRFRLVKQRFKRLHQGGLSLAGTSANWSQELIVELSHHRRRVCNPLRPTRGQLQLKGAGILRVIGAPQQAGALHRTGELRDIHDLKASEVGEFALARQRTTMGELLQRAEEEVVGVGQAEPIQGSVNGDPPLGREVPQQVSDGLNATWHQRT
jgi:hypothetical protein